MIEELTIIKGTITGREQAGVDNYVDYDIMLEEHELILQHQFANMLAQEEETMKQSELSYDIIDVKNSIAVIKWADGTISHVQTSSLNPIKLRLYWETKARETREYFENKS